MRSSTLIILTTLLLLAVNCYSQESQSKSDSIELANLSAELDALLSNEEDSLSLFSLIDSLLTLDEPGSVLSFRTAYSSRLTSAGRTFGLDQQGIIPGVSYYHKSGMFADLTGVWNSDLTPKYFLTIATLGYIGTLSKKWSYMLSYDHSFYHADDDTYFFPLTNSLNGSVTANLKHLYTGVDYSFSFGEETASSITWNATGILKRKAFKPFKNVTILPSISILFGNQNVTELNNSVDPRPRSVNRLLEEFPELETTLPGLTDQQIRIFAQRNGLGQRAVDLLILTRDELNQGGTTEVTTSQFGLLNYFLSLPVQLSTKKLNLTVSYNYNIPRALDNSDLSSESNSYFGLTLSYNIAF